MKIKAASFFKIALAVIAFILALVISYMLELNKSMNSTNSVMKQEKSMLEVKVTDVMKQKKSLEVQVTALSGEKDLLLKKVNEYEVQSKDMTERITNLEDKVQDIKKDFSKREIFMENVRAKKENEIFQLKGKLEEYQSSVQALNDKLTHVRKPEHGKKEQESPVKKKNNALEVEPVVVESRQIDTKIEAKILEVNTEYDFAVIDAGALDGIKEGDSMFVYDNNEVLGRVVIEKTEDNYSVARLLYKTLKDTVEKGDKVKY